MKQSSKKHEGCLENKKGSERAVRILFGLNDKVCFGNLAPEYSSQFKTAPVSKTFI